MAFDGRHAAGSALTSAEAARVVQLIRTELDQYVAKYDERKYPPRTYERLLEAFRTPNRTTAADIRQAILWKFGHLGKARIPAHHERLILELQRKWSRLVSALAGPIPEVFARLITAAGGPPRYITASFLAHLLRPSEVPIIDQHNFRAMNYYFMAVRSGWRSKAKPSAYEDVALLAAFVSSVRGSWGALDPPTQPSERTLDRFLMMFGKGLKAGSSQSRPNYAPQRAGRAGR